MFQFFTYCDVPELWQLNFQDPATPLAEGMIAFHNNLMVYCVFIGVFVCTMLAFALFYFQDTKHTVEKVEKFTHSSDLEIAWTVIPALILLFIALPSFSLLYSLEEAMQTRIVLKVIGHQWYWSYEFSLKNYMFWNSIATYGFDSYTIKLNDVRYREFRLLEVDNRILLPIKRHVRLLVTSADVLHSWAIPSFGVKIDACPGRLSQGSIYLKRYGVFYGQCSEICGINHGFMPITVRCSTPDEFVFWSDLNDYTSVLPAK